MKLLKTKCIVATIIILCSFAFKAKAQNLKLIPNPDSTSIGFSGNWSRTFNGKFYLPYQNASGKYQLAQFDGVTTKLYNNPDSGTINIFHGSSVFNNTLLFFYKDTLGKNCLAKFDGNQVYLLNNPDTGAGFNVNFLHNPDSIMLAYKNNLYNAYTDKNGHTQLAKYNGTDVSLVNLQDTTNQFNTFYGDLNVYNNIMYFVIEKNNRTNLAKYDGNSVTIINNPDSGGGIYYKLLPFNNEICFLYNSSSSYSTQFAKYDGNKVSIIPDPLGYGWYYTKWYKPTVFNNALYLLYGSGGNFLAKYDGKKITVLNNPDSTGGYIDLLSPTVWHNKLYCSYEVYDSMYNPSGYIAEYDGSTIKLLNNPDNGWGFGFVSVSSNGSKESSYELIDYKDTLFAAEYSNNNKKLALTKFDGSNFTLYNSQDITDKDVLNLRIINNKLFVVFQNKYGKYQIGQYTGTGQGFSVYNNPDTGTITSYPFVNSINNYVYLTYQNAVGKFQIATSDTSKNLPISISFFTVTTNNKSIQTNWHTSTELNTSHFIIQHSTDGSSFTDIGTVKAIGSGANEYSFKDNNPTLGINYYRLKSVDKDGGFSYSKIVSVQFTVNSNQLSVFPNPSKDKVTVLGNHIISVQMTDNLGRVIKTVSFKDASNPVLLLTGMASGIYHLRVQTTEGKVCGANLVVN